jgi:hypothetical protein
MRFGVVPTADLSTFNTRRESCRVIRVPSPCAVLSPRTFAVWRPRVTDTPIRLRSAARE